MSGLIDSPAPWGLRSTFAPASGGTLGAVPSDESSTSVNNTSDGSPATPVAPPSDVVDLFGYLGGLRRYAVPALLVATLVFAGAFLISGRGTDARVVQVDARLAVLPASATRSPGTLADLRVAAASYGATIESNQVLEAVAAAPGRGWTAAGVKAAVTVVVLTDSLLIDLKVQSASIEDATAMANATIAALQQEAPRQLGLTVDGAAPKIAVVSVPEATLQVAGSSRSSLQSLILAGLGALVAGFLVAAALSARADWTRRRSVIR